MKLQPDGSPAGKQRNVTKRERLEGNPAPSIGALSRFCGDMQPARARLTSMCSRNSPQALGSQESTADSRPTGNLEGPGKRCSGAAAKFPSSDANSE